MNIENEWYQMVECDVIKGPMEKVARKEIVEAIQKVKSEKGNWTIESKWRDDSRKWRKGVKNDGPMSARIEW